MPSSLASQGGALGACSSDTVLLCEREPCREGILRLTLSSILRAFADLYSAPS
jgi:hypothetical protein